MTDLVVVVVAVGSVIWLSHKSHDQKLQSAAVQQKAVPQAKTVAISVSSDGWNEKSTPVIVHLKGTDGNAKGVEFYHAATYEEVSTSKAEVAVVDGSYEVSAVSAINEDGSLADASAVKTSIVVDHIEASDAMPVSTPLSLLVRVYFSKSNVK